MYKKVLLKQTSYKYKFLRTWRSILTPRLVRIKEGHKDLLPPLYPNKNQEQVRNYCFHSLTGYPRYPLRGGNNSSYPTMEQGYSSASFQGLLKGFSRNFVAAFSTKAFFPAPIRLCSSSLLTHHAFSHYNNIVIWRQLAAKFNIRR